jgi:hypothetical protein
MKRILFILSAIALSVLPGKAQLSEMIVESIVDIGANITPEYDRTKNAMAGIEVVTNQPMPGLTIVDNGQAGPLSTHLDTDSVFYGHAVASTIMSAKYLTLVHPDFKPLNIELEKYPKVYPLKGDRIYRVTVSIPSAQLVSANKAYNLLQYDEATSLYEGITRPDNERDIAQIRLKSIPEFKEKLANAERFVAEGGKNNQIRAMFIYKDIHQQTKSTLAMERYLQLSRILFPNRSNVEGQVVGISELKVDTVTETNGVEAKTHTSIPRIDPSQPYYALLIVSVPLDSVTFSCKDAYHSDFLEKGEHYVVMKPGENGVNNEFVIKHRDCKDLSVRLKDYNISTLKSGITYRMTVSAPSFDMMEADRHFSALDFDCALPIYSRIDSLAAEYPADDARLAKVRKSQCLVCMDYQDMWEQLRNEVNSGGKLIDRKAMCAKIDTLITLSNFFSELGIASVKGTIEGAEKLKEMYQKCYHLTLLVTFAKGQPNSKELYVEFKRGNYTQVETARKLSGKKNEYRLFLPLELSEYVSRGGQVEFNVGTKKKNDHENGGTQSTKQIIRKDGENMNITFNTII